MRTINTEENTTRDNSLIKAKAGGVQAFGKKENMVILVRLQRAVKKFLKYNPRIRNKRNHFGGNVRKKF